MKIVYIHGANATSESFNYIREHINHESIHLEYKSENGFLKNLAEMKERIKDTNSVFFVAHSLGGIYALHLAHHYPKNVQGAVTIATPYGGSISADYVRWFLPFCQLLKDIGPCSEPMQLTHQISVTVPWTNIVTTQGSSPFMKEGNDGVVTVASMKKHARDMQLVEIAQNHYEILMSKQVVDIIIQNINKLN